jgi:MYXO-CTERM domain-containing protein
MPSATRPKTLLRAAMGAAALGSLLASSMAAAYVRTRSPDGKAALLWSETTITMTLRTSGTQVVPAADFDGAARRAAATWSAARLGTSVLFKIASSPDAPAGTRFDQINALSFRTDSWNEPVYPEAALALTTVWSRDDQIVDADTEINAADPRFKWGVLPDDPALAAMASEVDLQNALTHELGHVIGLSHPCYLGSPPTPLEVDDKGEPVLSCSDPALPGSVKTATMFPSSHTGSITERALSSDEIEALHALYPARPMPVATLGTRGGGCALAPGPAPPSAAPVVLLVGALGLHRRRRVQPAALRT